MTNGFRDKMCLHCLACLFTTAWLRTRFQSTVDVHLTASGNDDDDDSTVRAGHSVRHCALLFKGLDQKVFYSAFQCCVLSPDPLLSKQVQRSFMKCFEVGDGDTTRSVFIFASDTVDHIWGNEVFVFHFSSKSRSFHNTAVTLFWDKVDPSLPGDCSERAPSKQTSRFFPVDCNKLSVGGIDFYSAAVMTTGNLDWAILQSVKWIFEWITREMLHVTVIYQGWTSAAKVKQST